ncbi:ABC transporter ATP-binding protein [bacterium]|nr:ABC transporter ATP-binding protein [bacterium]
MSLSIPTNKLIVLLGPNGAGKSTLLNLITDNLKIKFHIENTFKNIFYLPQNPYYPIGITTFEYLSSVFFKNTWKWFLTTDEKLKIIEVLEKIELLDKKDIKIENLSGGEIQKANIGLGLLSGADLFLLDEPASNMDLINQVKILKMLKNLTSQGVSSVIIMHDVNLAIKYADEFIGVTTAHKLIQKNVKEFFNKETLKQVFDIEFEILEENDNFYVQIID